MSTSVKSSSPTSNYELIKQLIDFLGALNPTYTADGNLDPKHPHYKLIMSIQKLRSLFSVTYPPVHDVEPKLYSELVEELRGEDYFALHVVILELITTIPEWAAARLEQAKFMGR